MAHDFMLYLLLIPCAVFAKVYYVKPEIDTSCPADPCHTISEYAAQPQGNFSFKTRMILLQGEHYLSHTFSLHDIGELVFTGYDASLTCVQNIGFDIGNVENVTFTGLNIFGCTISCLNTDAVFSKLNIEHSCIQNVSNSKPAVYLSTIQESTIFNSSFVFIDVEETDSIACSAVRAHNTNLNIINSAFDRNFAKSDRLSSTICMFNSNVTLENSSFIGNKGMTGGVLYAENSKINSLWSIYSNNHVTNFGGVAYIQNAALFLDSCTFSDNKSGEDGGALYLLYGVVAAVDCVFQYNSAAGAGVLQLTSNSHAKFSNSSFVHNQANNSGVVSLFNACTITLRHCNFSSNKAHSLNLDHGYGAVLNADGSITINITGCTFVSNSASTGGGCIYMKKNSHAYLDGFNVFENNSAFYGGVFIVADHSSIDVNSGDHTCDNATEFTDNSAEYGGALNIIDYSTGNIQCSSFEANQAGRGGAILARTYTNVSLTGHTILQQPGPW